MSEEPEAPEEETQPDGWSKLESLIGNMVSPLKEQVESLTKEVKKWQSGTSSKVSVSKTQVQKTSETETSEEPPEKKVTALMRLLDGK